jgi:NADPH:quinone reductase-like Zn-dependent oxidoreductase
MTSLPKAMRAVQLLAYDGKPESISVAQVPVPQPGPGEVLVHMAAAPLNPSDLAFIRGLYGFKKPLPAIPGFEGSGTVLETGSGMMAGFLKGKRVACHASAPNIAGGTWAEYLVTPANACVPLRKEVDMEQGATMLINPLTAWALVEEARRDGHGALVQTAAASALGRMVVRLARTFSIPIINIVRRSEQVELLRGMGEQHVLNSNDPDFDARLHELCQRLTASIAFDAVAGETTLRVLRALPKGSRLLVYGALSLQPCVVDPGSLIFEQKRVEGFWLTGWLRRKNMLSQLRVVGQVQKLLARELKTDFQARLPFEQAPRALQQYATNMTAGKILLVP